MRMWWYPANIDFQSAGNTWTYIQFNTIEQSGEGWQLRYLVSRQTLLAIYMDVLIYLYP